MKQKTQVVNKVVIDLENMRSEILNGKKKLKNKFEYKRAFSLMDQRIEKKLTLVKKLLDLGESVIPEIEFDLITKKLVSNTIKEKIKDSGCVVIRNVFSAEMVDRWNLDLLNYVQENNYFEKQKAKSGMDKYFSNLTDSKPQIFGLYWSKPQMQARTSSEMAVVRSWLNRLWTYVGEAGQEFDPDLECLYADRLRQREPGDNTLGLSPHVDGGSVERWLDTGYQNVYRHIFRGNIDAYDPFDASWRTTSQEIPSPAVCSMFRTYQGWTALTKQGAGDGTLNIVPISDVMGWLLLRALQDDIKGDDLCGAQPGRAMTISEEFHKKLLDVYIPIPFVYPGDTVWWHPDIIHGVENENKSTGYSNVMYIGAAPDCEKNRKFLAGQKKAFEEGRSSPDFAAEDYETDFRDRFLPEELSQLGKRQMGY